ncbi:Na/Pi cotransporter family protein [Halanaerobacter jeridensis]|uniref:Phosphate:Na+ symporter n=1 Tax=Halanaerobacter jeridensis TaxID=706427 RepID=A0A938XQX1_9FIRM|nr:Na/Pi symporter [Halanaerobacter jeridensis]MBM7557892.1 phosphate:Na+ symporter [Halanaerobacter jeridensis]
MLKALMQCCGGLALFLWGLQKIKTNFQSVVSSKAKEVVSILTLNFGVAMITGLLITMLIQSSSAAIIIIISLVNLKLLDFNQAVGLIAGVNVGTTVTVQLISFNLTNHLGIFLGSGLFFYVLYYVTDLRCAKYFGQGLSSFSILLLGLELLSGSLVGLEENLLFINLIVSLATWPLLGLIVGLITTSIVQSSSAVTALVVALAKQRLIILEAAIAIALGSNIGTCVTAFLAGVGGSRDAKLSAWAHLYFNLVGVIIFLPLLPYFTHLIQSFSLDLSRQIANAHTLFNLLTAVVIFVFRNKFIALVYKLHSQEGRKEKLKCRNC